MSTKKAAWLNHGTARGHTAKPMKPETRARMVRRFVARKNGTAPYGDPKTGTIRYPTPSAESVMKSGMHA